MAGSYAKIFNEIWADPDFRSLNRDQQWLFFALISQPELNFAGVVTTTDRRLAGCAADFTVDELRADLAVLHARRYIVVDEEHDEILVRSYVRYDGAWRTPNVLTSIVRAASAVRSTAIRAALANEFDRLPLDELSGKKAEEMRASVARVTATLRPRVAARVTPTLAACVPEGLREVITEPIPEPIAQPTVVVAVVGEELKDRTSYTSPQDQPDPSGPVADGDGLLIQLVDYAKKPEPGSDDDPDWLKFWAAFPNKRSKQEARVRWAKAIRNGEPPALIIAGATRYADEMRRKRIAKDKIKHPDGWLNGRRWEDEEDEDDGNFTWDDVEEQAPKEFNRDR